MGRDIEMDESPRAHRHDQKHINEPKADGDGDEEITGQHSLGMVADERRPVLGWNRLASATIRILQQILLNGPRRALNSKVQDELGRDAGFPPARIVRAMVRMS